jgi:GT2 family glycosyltransferase
MNANKKETVCAVVVTYNRKNLLIECLEAIRKQTRPVDAIYIIDNASTDGTPDLLLEKGYIKELPPKNLTEPWEKTFSIPHLLIDGSTLLPIHYVRMHENTGGAGGFYEGVKRAYERGYDWLWLMDDDGKPKDNCLENLLNHKDKGDFLAPLVIDIDNKDELSFVIWDENKKNIKRLGDIQKEIYYKTANPFNGILISKKLVQKIGYPKKEMFIWGDEVEYQKRVIKNNFNVLTITSAIHYHPKGRVKQLKILNKFYINWQDNELKNYCDIRNRFYIAKHYSYVDIYKIYIKYCLAFLSFKISFKDFIFFLKASNDGLLENWGKERRYLK